MQTRKICNRCGNMVLKKNMIQGAGMWICRHCIQIHESHCYRCGQDIDPQRGIIADHVLWCRACYQRMYKPCENCGNMTSTSSAYRTRSGIICENCRELYYIECYSCHYTVKRGQTTAVKGRNSHTCHICAECVHSIIPCAECGEKWYYLDIVETGYNTYICPTCRDQKYIYCYHCGNVYRPEDMQKRDNLVLCQRCTPLYIYCDTCKKWKKKQGSMTHNDLVYCTACKNDHFTQCQACQEYFPQTDMHYDGNAYFCEDCYIDDAVRCYSCDHIVDRSETVYYDSEYYCEECYNNIFVECESCGDTIERDNAYYDDDGEAYCYSCWENRQNPEDIYSYSYKPQPIFHTKNGSDTHNSSQNLYMGFELEFEFEDAAPGDVCEYLKDVDRHEKNYYLKEDGSLERGCEIVTHPRTLASHVEYGWSKILRELSEMGCRSHDTGTCGLHIHVNRSFFTMPQMVRLGIFIHTQAENVKKISRRDPDRWGKFKKVYSNSTDYELTHNEDRYEALNWLNYNTIEFRTFKGTLKMETLIATLQFVDAACKFVKTTKSLTTATQPAETWRMFHDFISNKRQYTHLRTYLNTVNA